MSSPVTPILEVPLTDEQTRIEIEKKVRADLEVQNAKDNADFQELLRKENREIVQKELASWREAQKPPTTEDIQKVLSQEYITFSIEVVMEDGARRTFTLRELPQAIEKKFFNKLKDDFIPRLTDMQGLKMDMLEKEDAIAKIRHVVESFEPAFNLIADSVALVLNPYGKEPGVDRDWVQQNISVGRMWNIIQAQISCNRLRDFFSSVFRESSRLVKN